MYTLDNQQIAECITAMYGTTHDQTWTDTDELIQVAAFKLYESVTANASIFAQLLVNAGLSPDHATDFCDVPRSEVYNPTAKKMTAADLINAIRNADDLATLKRLVGQTEDDLQRAESRITQMDAMYTTYGKSHGVDMTRWPWEAQERYKRLDAEQAAYESEYC